MGKLIYVSNEYKRLKRILTDEKEYDEKLVADINSKLRKKYPGKKKTRQRPRNPDEKKILERWSKDGYEQGDI
ncbi:hypothetical protein [Marinilactibacillus sp. Marseille-P9653]|uniref:hypothetical protein n=1 Tax=Marinilactibacillus sp. Marseille-P9653 TaxID=2866583 RepID=UPI001CE4351F|nr:hypothetical protein [Marinilactibacillus sp. Marseille-P9653]